MKKIPLSEVKDDFSRCLRLAGTEEIVITRHGRPAGVLIGFESEDDWFDYCLERDPRFLARVAEARARFRAGGGVPFAQVAAEFAGQIAEPEPPKYGSKRRRRKGR